MEVAAQLSNSRKDFKYLIAHKIHTRIVVHERLLRIDEVDDRLREPEEQAAYVKNWMKSKWPYRGRLHLNGLLHEIRPVLMIVYCKVCGNNAKNENLQMCIRCADLCRDAMEKNPGLSWGQHADLLKNHAEIIPDRRLNRLKGRFHI